MRSKKKLSQLYKLLFNSFMTALTLLRYRYTGNVRHGYATGLSLYRSANLRTIFVLNLH